MTRGENNISIQAHSFFVCTAPAQYFGPSRHEDALTDSIPMRLLLKEQVARHTETWEITLLCAEHTRYLVHAVNTSRWVTWS